MQSMESPENREQMSVHSRPLSLRSNIIERTKCLLRQEYPLKLFNDFYKTKNQMKIINKSLA